MVFVFAFPFVLGLVGWLDQNPHHMDGDDR